ncbi:putative gamma-glutamylcyclotransferase CG2811 [Tubulanus polymorphus]|uniref:putative gamma-glutamylcyclotransferase CG2811 n=1 Tax=Tubulanus polymorphus TaxID=672921 RepID=UPI003DA24D51
MSADKKVGKHLVFVYGTLKKSQPNHHWFSKGGSYQFVGAAKLSEPRPMVVAGPYNIPYIIDCPGTGKNVVGEVYDIDDEAFAHLDILEDYPIHYTRKQIPVTLLNDDIHRTVNCWCYFLANPKQSLLELPHIECFNHAQCGYTPMDKGECDLAAGVSAVQDV